MKILDFIYLFSLYPFLSSDVPDLVSDSESNDDSSDSSVEEIKPKPKPAKPAKKAAKKVEKKQVKEFYMIKYRHFFLVKTIHPGLLSHNYRVHFGF